MQDTEATPENAIMVYGSRDPRNCPMGGTLGADHAGKDGARGGGEGGC